MTGIVKVKSSTEKLVPRDFKDAKMYARLK